MEKMNSKQIRDAWLKFFESKGHLIVEPKSLVPVNDNSLLWINSGVATLKDFFSGKKIPPSRKLTNSQKAIRTNDIENVGVTSRHHTFFEMLGNFSIGDYFKKEAIAYAKEFLENILKLDFNNIYITYFNEDEETKNLWIENGIDPSHMISGNRDTNFWDLGSGPCGPCTEIFYDRGEKYDKRGIELLINDIENDRFIEIWNIVFSQFNNDGEGNYTELIQKNIDTGAGLERIASIMQDVPTNYDSDLFQNIIHEVEKYTPYKYIINNYFEKNEEQTEINTSFKIIADHVRTVVNALADGAKISNVGRGYIIRRLIRRSCYKGMQLNIKGLFLYKLVDIVKDSLPFEYDVFEVANQIKEEELLFSKTVENGKLLLESHIKENTKIFDGSIAFKLLETYGFPIELTEEILIKKGIKIDMNAFLKSKEAHALASKGNKGTGMDRVINSLALINNKIDEFIGYTDIIGKTNILKLLDEENEIDILDGKGYLILKRTPFYATSGGQRHDKGYLIQGKNRIELLEVFKDKFGNHIHVVNGKVNKNEEITCFVDPNIRLGLERNHSGTHLLFCALRHILGSHIEQLGSDNNEERLTFDFPADERPTDEEIAKIEDLMQSYISQKVKREYLITTVEKAKEMGAIMTLEEGEYMDPRSVRIVKFGNITSDLCGGTHLSNTEKLENFKITHVERKQAGVFRIRAISSNKLVKEYWIETNQKIIDEINAVVNKTMQLNNKYTFDSSVDSRLSLEEQNKLLNAKLEKVREDYKLNLKNSSVVKFNYEKVEFEKINSYDVYLNLNVDASQVKVIAATIRDKYDSNKIVIVGSQNAEQIILCIASRKIDSNKLFSAITQKISGRGGGSAILAMGKVGNTENSLQIIKEIITKWEN
ncbi:alanine--tRNA ligase [Mycoplasma sp. 1331]|uniref:Alanine--tRNA ligase n=2 Tax=Mycoplasma tauri TaxID=547987 RepID=A0A953NEN7_9MOLU|nr:alanine--tRNA ligase [Mycoplasma tauri]MBZ4195548.1 alanine--tRNA ligase [Mycoplasma tauri]